MEIDLRRPNAAACDHEIVVVAHALDSFNDLVFIVGYDLDSF
jgi:hypothetical protein